MLCFYSGLVCIFIWLFEDNAKLSVDILWQYLIIVHVVHIVDLDLFVVYVAFNSQGHITTASLQVEETSAYCTVNHWASASNYQLSNMRRLARTGGLRGWRREL